MQNGNDSDELQLILNGLEHSGSLGVAGAIAGFRNGEISDAHAKRIMESLEVTLHHIVSTTAAPLVDESSEGNNFNLNLPSGVIAAALTMREIDIKNKTFTTNNLG